MKRTALNLTLAAAAVLVAVTSASAQNMKAEIPFPFVAAGARLQPGTYSVTVGRLVSGTPTFQLYNAGDKHGTIAIPHAINAPLSARNVPIMLSFACTNGHCVLASLRDDTATVYTFPAGKRTPETQIATVLVRPDRGE